MAADALGTPAPAATPTVGVVSDEDHRLAMAGMIAAQSSTLAVRTGVMWGPNTTALVTGTAATGTMTVSIAVHHAVTTRGTGDGIYLGPTLDAATTVNIAAAPGSNSRIDVVYAKQNDSASSISPDGSTAPLYGVVTGTAAVSPTKPAIPVGAIELATVTVAAGATSTNGAGVTITNTAAQTVARGADIPVRSVTERDALTTYIGLAVKRLDDGGRVERWTGTAWSGPSTHYYNAGTNGSTSLTTTPTAPSGGASVSVPAGTFDVDLRAYFALSVGAAPVDINMGVYNGSTQLFATDFNVNTVGGASSKAHSDFTRLTLASAATLTLKFWTSVVSGTQAVSGNAIRAVQVS